MRSLTIAVRLAALVLISLAMSSGFAQNSPDPGQPPDAGQAQDQDPPGRVARLSLAEGSVSLQPAGVQDWSNADVNRPLTTGDKLWSDQDARAELDIGSAAIRLGSNTGFSFLNLDDHTVQMQVTAGTVIVRVRSLQQGDTFEVNTPNLAVSLLEPGQYRVEVNDAGDTTAVAVSEGDAQAAGDGQGYPIHAQQKATFTGTQQLSSVIGTLGAPDDLDDWSLSRDRQVQSAQSQQYVSTDATGYADLDNNGRWQDTPDYGYVWTPTTVAVGWAPYRFGHWVWVAPWGWTWIDNAPWGFAPFHYGRWVMFNNAWAWVPGPRHVRPVYAPALVAWVGGPPVGGVAIGASVGWFPLAPREVYVPAYRVSAGYVQRVNVTNTVIVNRTYITNVYENRVTNINYVNRNVNGAVTVVSQTTFTSAQPVGHNLVRDPDVRTWSVRPVAPAIAPTRVSLVSAAARVDVRRPPAAIMSRPVVVKTEPPRAPVPFDRQSAAIRANGGRPLGRDELARLQPSTPAAPVRVVTPNRGGFQRPVPNQPSMADRERALRDGRPFGSAEGQRPPVAPPPGNEYQRPNQPQPGNEYPRRNEAPPGNDYQRPNQPQLGSQYQRPNEPQPRYDRPPRPAPATPQTSPRNDFPAQGGEPPQRFDRPPRGEDPSQRFDRQPQAETRPQAPQNNAPEVRQAPPPPRPQERPTPPPTRQAPPPQREAPRPPPASQPQRREAPPPRDSHQQQDR